MWEMDKISLLALGNNSSVGLAMQIDMVLKKPLLQAKTSIMCLLVTRSFRDF